MDDFENGNWQKKLIIIKVTNGNIFTKIEAMKSFLTRDETKMLLSLCELPADQKFN